MTAFAAPAEPDWTRKYKGSDLKTLGTRAYMLRESKDSDSPWRHAARIVYLALRDPETSIWVRSVSVGFDDGGHRVVNESDDIEVGFVRPPDWSRDK